jgi:hypothetical protein
MIVFVNLRANIELQQNTMFDVYYEKYVDIGNKMDKCFSDMKDGIKHLESVVLSFEEKHKEYEERLNMESVEELNDIHYCFEGVSNDINLFSNELQTIRDETLNEKETLVSYLLDSNQAYLQIRIEESKLNHESISSVLVKQEPTVESDDDCNTMEQVDDSNEDNSTPHAHELLHNSLKRLDITTRKFVEMFDRQTTPTDKF